MSIAQNLRGLLSRRRAAPLNATTAQRRAARELLILQDDVGTGVRHLAVGLVWRPLMQADSARSASTMAKDAHASHFAVLPTKVCGYGIVPKAWFKKQKAAIRGKAHGPQITPVAALAISRLGSTPALLAIDLGEGETWLCVLRNQRPEGSEEIVRSNSGDAKDARAALQRIREIQAIPGNDNLILHTDLANAKANGAVALSLADLTSLPFTPGSQLQPIGAAASSDTVPKPVLVTALVGILGYIAYSQYTAYEVAELAAKKAAERARSEISENPQAAWQAAIAASIPKNRRQPGVAVLQALRTHLTNVPVDWLGWDLKSLKCQAQATPSDPKAGTAQAWDCLAQYEPAAKGRPATNLELSRAVPTGMHAEFLPTTHASLAWRFEVPVAALDAKSLPTKLSVLMQTASKLQELNPFLTEAPNFAFAPMKVVEPKTAGGQVIARPADVALPLEGALVVHGPLRVMKTLVDASIAADWKSMSLAVNRDAGGAVNTPLVDSAATAPNKQSMLMLTLEGALYAQD